MEAINIFLGIAIGVVIGQQYYKYQIVKKKNKKVIEQVKKWITDSEK
ncbi:MAG: hypothetical protein IJE62_02930 [Clostridia bacterium]|nr:hypothetical protein [Clostridia bacterium]